MTSMLKNQVVSQRGQSTGLRYFICAGVVAGFALGLATLSAAEVDVTKLPPAAKKQVDYAKEIKPMLTKACLDCHAKDGAMGKFQVDDFKLLLKGGSSGKAILPGKSEKSPLIHYVAYLVKDMEMPPKGDGDPLTKEQIGLLRAWIDQGAKEVPEKK